MFPATSFIIAQTWKQSGCPSAGEWINKLWYIQTTEYYWVLKGNELFSHEETWRNLKCLSLNKGSQSEKAIHTLWFSLYAILGKNKTIETVKRLVVAKIWVGEGWIHRAQKIFKSVKLLCMILLNIMVDLRHLHLSKPMKCPWSKEVRWSELAQSCPTLCNPMDCSPPGSSFYGILQARILEWVATPFSRRSSQPRDGTQVSHSAGGFFTNCATREANE